MGLDLDSGHDGFGVAAIIQQRRETRPALLAHAIAFVQDCDPAADHRGQQGGCHITQFGLAFDHRGDQQILRPRIHGGLHDVDFALQALGRRVGQRGLSDARFAEQARIHRDVLGIHHQPGSQQLPHYFFLTHPSDCQLIGMRQMKSYPFDLYHHTFVF